jgi:hypothetical protein
LNYFLPTLAAATIIAAPELDRVLQAGRRFSTLSQLLLGVGVSWVVFAQLREAQFDYNAFPPPSPQAIQELSAIHGRVITDMPELVLLGASPGIEAIEPMPLNAMLRHGTFDDRPLLKAIRERRIAAFALTGDLLEIQWLGRHFFWPALREAIARNYYLASESGPPFILLPRKD